MSTPRQCSSTNVLYKLQGIHAHVHPLEGPNDFERGKKKENKIPGFSYLLLYSIVFGHDLVAGSV